MFSRHGSKDLNPWDLVASLALIALFAAPILLQSFAALFGCIAALFVLVTVMSLISASRGGPTTFALLRRIEPIRTNVRERRLPRIRSRSRRSGSKFVAWSTSRFSHGARPRRGSTSLRESRVVNRA
jgi:hypothetical protein